MFKKFREKRIDRIIDEINRKNIINRYAMLLFGCLILAFTFNLFFLRYDIVCFGVSGISIVMNKFGIPPSTFIMVVNIILLIISYFFLGINDTKNQIIKHFNFNDEEGLFVFIDSILHEMRKLA